MAATQGIGSPFSTQVAPHSSKLRVYEYLFLLNQTLQDTVQILKKLEKCPWLHRNFLRSFQVEVEDLRAQTNFEVIEQMSDREQHDWARFGKLRRQWENPARVLVFLTAATGLRVSEALGLKWSDVDFSAGQILLAEQ